MLSLLATRAILKRKDVKEENAYQINRCADIKIKGQNLSVTVRQEQTAETPEQRIDESALQQRNISETVEDNFVTSKAGSGKERKGEEERSQRELWQRELW